MRLILILFALLSVSACASVVAPPRSDGAATAQTGGGKALNPEVAAQNFISVVDVVEPVAERICRAELPAGQCDYQIVVDSRPGQPPNAYQSLDQNGRPIISFTVALIADARNKDELAFILGHEAAHHIGEHIPKTQKTAVAGALLAGVLATVTGVGEEGVRSAQDIGASVGARAYSKDFELEADALGTVIAFRAGFDPERGAKYFERIPDPGNQFLGTHPANDDRIETVRRTLATLQ